MKSGAAALYKTRIETSCRNYYLVGFIILSLLMINTVCLGQATSKRKVDYAPAVEEFIKQGLFPDIKGARYVKVKDENLQWTCDEFWFEDVAAMSKLTGNGFYIPNKEANKPARFIFFGGYELIHIGKGVRMNESMDYQSSTRGTMKDADLKKDIAVVQKWAETASSDDEFEYYGDENFAVAFGFANLAYQMGLKDEANLLFKTLFLNHEDPEKFIDHLINSLANKEYMGVYQSFNQKQDWAKYHASLIKLQEKYPRGWENQPGLELLIPLVKSRMDKEPVKSPVIEGVAFTAEVQKLIDATGKPSKASAAGNRYYERESLFLINKPKKSASAPAFQQLTHYGMDGFIGLVALIGDETLVAQNSGSGYSSHTSYSSSYYDDDRKSPEAAYSSLNKPSTRGMLAEAIVRATMPQDRNSLSEMDSDQLKRFCINWWKEHKNDSKIELTKHYLQEGNQSHVQSLAMALMTEDTDESRVLLEKSILASKRPSYLSDIVKSYVKKRREKAKDFIVLYKKALIQEVGDGLENGNYNIRRAGGTEKYIASLMRYTSGLKPAQMLANLAKKDAKVNELIEMLAVSYKGKDVTKDLNKFIYAAAKKERVSDKSAILSGLIEMIYVEPARGAIGAGLDGFIFEDNGDAELSAEMVKKLLAKQLEDFKNKPDAKNLEKPAEAKAKPQAIKLSKYERLDWEKLLFSNEGGRGTKISTLSGMILDKYAYPSRTKAEYRECQTLGLELQESLIQERSRAILDGKEVEPLPSQKLVTKERKAEVLKLIKSTKPINLRAVLETLNDSEKIVVFYDGSEEVEAIFAEAGEYIQGFAALEPIYKLDNYDQLKEILKPLIGKKPDAETYDQCAKLMLSNLNDFAGASLGLNVSGHRAGKNIAFYDLVPSSGNEVKKAKADVVAGKSDGFVVVIGYKRDQTQVTLIYKDGSQPTKEDLTKILESPNVIIRAMSKASIEKLEKERAATADERKKLIDEIIKVYPSLEQYKERFEDMKVEQLKQSLKQYKQMQGQEF